MAFLNGVIARRAPSPHYLYARAEVRRLRPQADLDGALADLQAACALGNEPPQTHRSLGFVYRSQRRAPEAVASFQRYLELAPQAPDALMIRSYIEELRA